MGLSTNPEVTRRITEWQPTTIRDGTGVLFFASLAAVLVLIARSGRALAWPTLASLGTFVAIGLYAQRGLAWWPLAAAVVIAGLLARHSGAGTAPAEPATPPTLRRLNVVVAAALVLAAVALLPAWRPIDSGTGVPVAVLTDAPSGITAALRGSARPGDRIFNPQPWGSWFEFALPETQVALDSRIEFFPVEVWDDYEGVVAGADGWEARLQAWHVAFVVTGASHQAFRDRLVAAGWATQYEDADGSVLRAPGTASDVGSSCIRC